ncbi:hypothetical protein SGRA_0044 [Saprospira grandis str. Lewin]|uniref:Uncharacterized protein n=1 Tax=Saprospira grandis (strain Lewin) TaxID=984262 RepID=H6L4B0_SAPGL|nr:hypothetical protein SGRA_0044 [Saprospira grandis str. Lewin]
MFLGLLFAAIGLQSCSKENEEVEEPIPTAMLINKVSVSNTPSYNYNENRDWDTFSDADMYFYIAYTDGNGYIGDVIYNGANNYVEDVAPGGGIVLTLNNPLRIDLNGSLDFSVALFDYDDFGEDEWMDFSDLIDISSYKVANPPSTINIEGTDGSRFQLEVEYSY